jgi:hypothetical protein
MPISKKSDPIIHNYDHMQFAMIRKSLIVPNAVCQNFGISKKWLSYLFEQFHYRCYFDKKLNKLILIELLPSKEFKDAFENNKEFRDKILEEK